MANENLIKEVLDLELDMFVNVNSRYPVSCQENPDAFRLHRGAQFSAWSDEALESYRSDLIEAKARGDNLMTLKYARMEGLIPPINENPLIDEIAQIELDSQKDVLEKYPNAIARPRPLTDDSVATSFLTYLKGELETYSDRTLYLLHRDIIECRDSGKNWAREVYDNLMRRLGFESLDDAEQSVIRRKQQS